MKKKKYSKRRNFDWKEKQRKIRTKWTIGCIVYSKRMKTVQTNRNQTTE